MFAPVPSPSDYSHLRWLVLPRNKWNSFSPEENSEPTRNFRFPVVNTSHLLLFQRSFVKSILSAQPYYGILPVYFSIER